MVNQASILEHAELASVGKSEQIVEAARQVGKQTAFLSHSHKDANLAKALQGFLHANGWTVYLDWQDTSMPSQPNEMTANKIKGKIEGLDWFIYLATANSALSRWCPWEIGYADGTKDTENIVIIPTSDNSGNNYGNEYLDLYRHIDETNTGRYALFEVDNRGILLEYV